MTIVRYRLSSGSVHEVDVSDGQSVMEGSVQSNLPGIVADCGGSCSCATCHVYLDPECAAAFDPPSDEERELLEFTEGTRTTSRLACQLILRGECPEIGVMVPDSNN
ncbi:2Fe-2S iron-sulfur cluster binding domain-containing protein (plasmid) [Rhodococcus erythropolis]|uniref:2Fe-2S iron-sulfur cluster-binding protein n=1 Tax=Rhodococcus baikonurensis TaxID=172041 RepID=A0ABV5XM79_9NOCA|nr:MULTISPECIES: 2Fe-2S iron-sulfur cluster-binding protein [Rhodococcus]MCJ0949894.1 2Fe-2S iron-sulfur cluster-binding protein [Rhodococcus sp. ARC_M8]MCQ4152110.1 2Fe-2S iron-sulfur cluster-binding protein [Rhodococcus qingshengii]MDJ0441236.1 2Fe-2S iron-sulfur cluster-binding protein [Rhodococcus qingshengii]QEX08446.1 2Fe-2S iron-sulfur cluster binding domain-containing protein [Rhodococcus erythropolis]